MTLSGAGDPGTTLDMLATSKNAKHQQNHDDAYVKRIHFS